MTTPPGRWCCRTVELAVRVQNRCITVFGYVGADYHLL